MNNLVWYVKWLVSNIYGHYTIYEKNPNSFPTIAYIGRHSNLFRSLLAYYIIPTRIRNTPKIETSNQLLKLVLYYVLGSSVGFEAKFSLGLAWGLGII